MLKRFVSIAAALLVFCVAAALLVQPVNALLGYQLDPLARPAHVLPEGNQSIGSQAASSVSTPLLVNAQNPLPDNYHPQNLVNLYDQRARHF
jgi:hypothetical protein